MKLTSKGTTGRYPSYNFRTKDPVIDRLQSSFQASGWGCKRLAAETGLSPKCVEQIFYGATVSPRFSTVARIAIALGRSRMAIAE